MPSPTNALYKWQADEEVTSFKLNRAFRQVGPGYFIVTAYGATGDGATDDTGSIQDTIDAAKAAGGGTVFFPSGVYIITTALLVSGDGITLLGSGGATILSKTSAVGAQVSITANSTLIDSLTFDGAQTTPGTQNTSWGLIDISNNTATPYTDLVVRRCYIQNSAAIGIRVKDHVNKVSIEDNYITYCFTSVFAQTTVGGSFSTTDCRVVRNRMFDNWGTGAESGACKWQGTSVGTVGPLNFVFDDNVVSNTGEMGIEIWKNGVKCAVRNNQITQVTFGVSLDLCSYCNVENNNISKTAYCGLEAAAGTNNCLYAGNVVNNYSSGTTRGGTYGVISSNVACFKNIYHGNTITGCFGSGIEIQENSSVWIVANRIEDCPSLVYLKFTNYARVLGNHLFSPSHYHVFLDYNDGNGHDIDIDGNYFFGTAPDDNIILYDALHGNTLTNVRITNNNVIDANYTNFAINRAMSVVNMQVYNNYYLRGSGHSNFTSYSSNPELLTEYPTTGQRAGLSVVGYRSLTYSASANPAWFKIWSEGAGLALFMQVHVFGQNGDGTTWTALNALVAAAPFSIDSGVTIYPQGNYLGGLIGEVIYNNPTSGDGSTQEIWIKVLPSANGGTLSLHFSDYIDGIIDSPAAVTTEPTWAPNFYKMNSGPIIRGMNAPAFTAKECILSSALNAITEIGGRLHIRGAGVSSEIGVQGATRVARFDIDDASEAVGVDNNGLLLVRKTQFLGDTTSATTQTGGGVLWSASGVLKWRDPSGTDSTIAPLSGTSVTSVNGYTGVVVLSRADFNLATTNDVTFQSVQVTAGSFAQGRFYATANEGLVIGGKSGVNSDLYITDPSAQLIWRNSAGTTDSVFASPTDVSGGAAGVTFSGGVIITKKLRVDSGVRFSTLSSGLVVTDSSGNISAGAGTTAPGTSSLTLSGSINVYGGNANLLGNPTDWEAVVINGTTYKIPLYT